MTTPAPKKLRLFPKPAPKTAAPPPPPNDPAERRSAEAIATNSTVYLVQEPSVPKHNGRTLDLTPLMWHGKVKVLMERSQNASYAPAASFVQLQERLLSFDPDRDFIAMAGGDTLGFALVSAVLKEMGHDHFTYLRFERTKLPDGSRDPTSGAYVPILVPLNEEAVTRMLLQ